MKFEVTNKNNVYQLIIDGEQIYSNEKELSEIISKIIAYLKLRFTKSEKPNKLMEIFKWDS